MKKYCVRRILGPIPIGGWEVRKHLTAFSGATACFCFRCIVLCVIYSSRCTLSCRQDSCMFGFSLSCSLFLCRCAVQELWKYCVPGCVFAIRSTSDTSRHKSAACSDTTPTALGAARLGQTTALSLRLTGIAPELRNYYPIIHALVSLEYRFVVCAIFLWTPISLRLGSPWH